jgi:hypothetical protein
LVRAYTGIIEKLGAGCATIPPGSPKARIAQSSTSSEPQPITISSGATPA